MPHCFNRGKNRILHTLESRGTKIDAKPRRSARRSLSSPAVGRPWDRAKALREKLAADISKLSAAAEAADARDEDPQALPAEIARREALKAKLDAARARLEAEAKAEAEAEAERPQYEAKKAAWEAKTGRGGQPPKPPDDKPPADRQINPGLRRGRL